MAAYHVVIEERAGRFWLRDLGSPEGTVINGEAVTMERPLADGDRIVLGGASEIEVRLVAEPRPSVEPSGKSSGALPAPTSGTTNPTATTANRPPPAEAAPAKLQLKLIAAGIFGGMGLTAVIAALLLRPACDTKIAIVSPHSGDTIRGPVPVLVRAEKSGCIKRVIYRLGGGWMESATTPPYQVWLDPAQLTKQFSDLAGREHELSATVEDAQGRVQQSVSIKLKFAGHRPSPEQLGEPLQKFAQTIAAGRYIFEPGFIEAIALRASTYPQEVIDAGVSHLRPICDAFSTHGLPPQLGLVLAMSRSRFISEPSASFDAGAAEPEVTFWRLPLRLAKQELTSNESEDQLKSPKRAVQVGAAYTKELWAEIAEDQTDFVYLVAWYGLPPEQVREHLTRLHAVPGERRNFWKMKAQAEPLLPPQASDRVVEFFAAGLVAFSSEHFQLRSRPQFSVICGK